MARLKGTERKGQLMDVATRQFAQHGYKAATTAGIADAAGITEPVLYRHFENKKDLFIAVLRRCTAMLVSRWRAAADDAPTACDKIRHMASAVYSELPELSDAQRVVHGAIATNRDPDVRVVLEEHLSQFISMVREMIQLGQDGGEFRNDFDVEAMAWSMINMYTGYGFVRLNMGEHRMDIRIGVEMMLNGLRPRNA
jgi:AcrR family transcriptional regulator